MSGKKKYTDEFKLNVVMAYLDGHSGGYDRLSEKYGIERSRIRRWVALYKAGGIEQLTRVTRKYSGEFRIYVVEYMHQNSISTRKAAATFGIQSAPTISKWERIYYEEGKAALMKERRGRRKDMSKPKKTQVPNNDVNENEDLLKEVQYLRMENEYLKKLIALVQERERSEQETE